jgi:hypothetical protein
LLLWKTAKFFPKEKDYRLRGYSMVEFGFYRLGLMKVFSLSLITGFEFFGNSQERRSEA